MTNPETHLDISITKTPPQRSLFEPDPQSNQVSHTHTHTHTFTRGQVINSNCTYIKLIET